MIESLKSVISANPESYPPEPSKPTVESTALAGAAAIQQIIADRDALRVCASSQQHELANLRAINQELQGRIAQIRKHYVGLGTKIIEQLEQFDGATRDAMTDIEEASTRTDETTLVDLASRLAPGHGQPRRMS